MKKIILSVIIVNHNGEKYASRCIRSILNSKTNSFEIIVVDNGSTKSDVEIIKKKFANKVRIVALNKNLGPSSARNEGVKISKGEYLAFLDNDTTVDPMWAIPAVQEFKKNKHLGVIQCKLLFLKNPTKIDYVGEYLGQNGFLVQRSNGDETDEGQYDQKVPLLAAKSAGMFIRKKAFLSAGGFDNDYFIYVEETDLGWRSWLSGYETIFLPSSKVLHEFGTSRVILGKKQQSYNGKFHGSKNYILTLFKNLDTKHLFTIFPLHILLWFGLAGFNILKGEFYNGYWILKGIAWNIIYLFKNYRKRMVVQKSRKISDEKLFSIVMKRKPFAYFLHKATYKHTLGNAESF